MMNDDHHMFCLMEVAAACITTYWDMRYVHLNINRVYEQHSESSMSISDVRVVAVVVWWVIH
jgi:hypothetical protein